MNQAEQGGCRGAMGDASGKECRGPERTVKGSEEKANGKVKVRFQKTNIAL